MENPVLVEVTRGDVVESVHRGAFIVLDADGGAVAQSGDVKRPVFPRSAVKAIQALPLVESGAADAFGFGEKELALACASHSGEPEHADLARAMLKAAGLEESALECGAHWPSRQQPALALARGGGEPGPAHNNCSGKHAGFICTCTHRDIDHAGYVSPGHAAQEAVREVMEAVTGAPHRDAMRGTDGCSIPTYAVPLEALALGFARMATGHELGAARAAAARRLMSACMAEPFFVAGTGRADTRIMSAGGGRLFSKIGAEGVYCAAIPELGLGIALKIDDGAARAAEAAVAALFLKLLPDLLASEISAVATAQLTNWNGIKVGSIRPAGALA